MTRQRTPDVIKSNNEAAIVGLGLEVNESLPLIESLDAVRPKSAREVAARACALSYVIGIGFNADRKELIEELSAYRLWDFVSERERALLLAQTVSEQDRLNATWLAECIQALAWVIGLVELDHFRECDADLAQRIPFRRDPSPFIESAVTRPLHEIQQQADLLYRLHWYATHCRLHGKISRVSESVVMERRRAIDWAYGTAESWDQVPLDT